MKEKILVTPRSLSRHGHPALETLRQAGYRILLPFPGRQPTKKELKEVLPSCVGYLAGAESIPAEVLDASSLLKVISRNGVGVDNIDLEAAKKLGIEIKIATGANSQGVAELALALMLASLRSIPRSDTAIKQGNWERKKGLEARGRVLGVVGCGQIGRRLIEMALGIGMVVRGYDLYPDPSFMPQGDFEYISWEVLLTEADVLSFHCPPGEEPIINAETLSRLKDGVYLVNTARAALIDEQALLTALEVGKVASFATDVYPTEPPELTPLFRHKDVITTPHLGGFTEESIRRAAEVAVDNLLDVLA